MPGNSFGKLFRVTTAGVSHGPGYVVIIDGCPPGLPLSVEDLLPDLRKKYGVVVAARAGDSPYTGDSLQLGDVIYSVNSLPVTSIDSLRTALDGLKDNEALVLQVQRGDRLIFLTMEIE